MLIKNFPFYLFYAITYSIHLCQYEFMDSYFIQWVITHGYNYLFKKFIYSAAPGLSCDVQDLLSSSLHVGSLIAACKLSVVACGI